MMFFPLSDISLVKVQWTLKVKIDRMWFVRTLDSRKEKLFFELLLIDEQGTAIQATIKKILIKKFENLVDEGSTYIISNLDVGLNNGKVRVTSHDYY
ncbi:hypothetical protein ACS0TY_008067 [Phlomoides rotata]